MKNCLICQTGQDQVALNRIPVNMEGAHWGDFLVCVNCFEVLKAEEVKNLIQATVLEKSFESTNVILVGESIGNKEDESPVTFELSVTAALLRDQNAFANVLGEKLGLKLWEMHRHGPSEAVWTTSLTPDGEGGFILAAAFIPGPAVP